MNIDKIKNEQWRQVPVHGYPDYRVSDKGRVYSNRTKKLMTPQATYKGYLKVGLSYNGVWKGFFVHRLVALAFIENPNGYSQVNHKNFDKEDNRSSNLEWCTDMMNQIHKYKSGRQWPSSTLNDKKVLKIREKFKAGYTRRMLGEEFGVAATTIKDIVLRRTWKHI